MFRYEDFTSGTNDIKRSELLRYLQAIGITTDSSNGSSHLRLTNAAGSRQNLVMHATPVNQGTRHSIRKFVDEHLAALEPKQEDAPPPPIIRIDDDDAIEAAGLQLQALSQEDFSVTFTDASYTEIAVTVYLHDDLLVKDSHIKAAAAERDALVAAYEAELEQLQKEHNIRRVIENGEPRLQIISRSSGYKKSGTTDVAVPTLEQCDSITQLNDARAHALRDISLQAERLEALHAEPARQPMRPQAMRQAEFNAMRSALEAVGLTLEVKRVDASRVAYDCRYAAHTFPSTIEGQEARKMRGKTDGELRRLYPEYDEEMLHSLLEVHSGKGMQLHCVIDSHNDGAPSEEALAQLREGIAQQAVHRKALMTSRLVARSGLVVQAKEDGVHYMFPSAQLQAGEPRFGVATHAMLEYIERPLQPAAPHAPFSPEVMRDLRTMHHIRTFDGYRRYEQQLLDALSALATSAVFVEDAHGCHVSLRSKQQAELVKVPVDLSNANGLNPYLLKLATEVERVYKATLPKAMASFGWKPARETAEQCYYTHATLPGEVGITRYSSGLLNHAEVLATLDAVDVHMEQAEQNHVNNERADAYRQSVDVLKQLGYREVANGAAKLCPPHNVAGLSAIRLRDPENYTVKQSDLKLLLAEMQKAADAQQRQQELVERLYHAFGDDFAMDDAGITLQLPTRKGDKTMPHHFAFAETRTGEPSGYFAIDAVKQMTATLNARTGAGFADKYAQRTQTPGGRLK